jgi:hypothetical protein
MICKQEVRGSNPRGSTSTNASVLLMDGGVRPINGPLDQDESTRSAVVVTRVRAFGPNSRVQRIRDLSVSVADRVLVDQRGPVAVVAHPRFQVGEACAALCGPIPSGSGRGL